MQSCNQVENPLRSEVLDTQDLRRWITSPMSSAQFKKKCNLDQIVPDLEIRIILFFWIK